MFYKFATFYLLKWNPSIQLIFKEKELHQRGEYVGMGNWGPAPKMTTTNSCIYNQWNSVWPM